MKISITDAKAQLTDLVHRSEAGEEVVLTRHGQAVARLVAVKAVSDKKTRRRVLEAVRAAAIAKAVPGVSAARSQDFLYEDGMPG